MFPLRIVLLLLVGGALLGGLALAGGIAWFLLRARPTGGEKNSENSED